MNDSRAMQGHYCMHDVLGNGYFVLDLKGVAHVVDVVSEGLLDSLQ